MRRGLLTLCAALCAALLAACAGAPARRVDAPAYDVCVYGATSAGVAAAVAADRLGASVLLVQRTPHVGGMSSSGLGATDVGDKAAIGGIAREFYRRIRTWYADPARWTREEPHAGAGWREGEDAMWRFEPHVAELVFEAMLAEGRVERLVGRLDRERGVELVGGAVASLSLRSGVRVRARTFVDATYEGDLLAAAGVTFTVGREANATYGETYGGVQVENAVKHQFEVDVDPWRLPGDPESGPVVGVRTDHPGAQGAADRRVQAYNFRVCLTDDPTNLIPFARPTDYDEAEYELLFRWFEAGEGRVPWHSLGMPNRKTDTNNNRAVSTDWIGGSWAYPEADDEERERIVRAHERYQRGLLWSLANHPRVPEAVRAEVGRWGLAADEFPGTGGWPRELYVREARRMVADYVVTDRDCLGLRRAPDPVGLGAYNMDSHNVQRYVDARGFARNEGDVQVPPAGPYGISYRAIVPRRGECTNLLVPVCLSASHIAFGSIRMEPVFQVLGQSAATAAVLAVRNDVAVQEVDYGELRELLLAGGQRLETEVR